MRTKSHTTSGLIGSPPWLIVLCVQGVLARKAWVNYGYSTTDVPLAILTSPSCNKLMQIFSGCFAGEPNESLANGRFRVDHILRDSAGLGGSTNFEVARLLEDGSVGQSQGCLCRAFHRLIETR